MNIKKIFLIGLTLLCLVGCTNVKDLGYDEIVNMLSTKKMPANTYKKGYQFYVPRGLMEDDGGSNYAILNSGNLTYYLYVDLVSYANDAVIDYEVDKSLLYSKKISYEGKNGFAEIKLLENNKYLIEIMYNYAKIEVMVDYEMINNALYNAINILKSIEYNDVAIQNLLESNELDYTEENYELFDEDKSNSNILDYIEEDIEEDDDEVIDTDFIN